MFIKAVKKVYGFGEENGSIAYHASPFYAGEVSILDLSKDISDACTLNVTDVEAVLTSLMRKLPSYLKNGFIVQLGSFGRMRLSLHSDGKATQDEVSGNDVRGSRIVFIPSSEMKKELKDIKFQMVKLAEQENVEQNAA